MFQFLKCHIIKASCSLRRSGRHCHFGVVFQVGGESERAFFAFFTSPPKGHHSSASGIVVTITNPAAPAETSTNERLLLDQDSSVERIIP